jgi:anthranilate synthase/aminodeoxychorismate synthase-like glutamine amidotransferase
MTAAVRVVVVDNYDSFTFNVVDLLERAGARCDVVANDAMDVEELARRDCDAFVVSPGPCDPARSGVSLPLCRSALAGHLGARPLFGVCLGHQAIAAAAGARVVRGIRPVHGKTTAIAHARRGVLRTAPALFRAAQYNSLVVEPSSLDSRFEVTATSADTGEVMALRHVSLPIESVQFHPESHLSEAGMEIARAFLEDVLAARGGSRP